MLLVVNRMVERMSDVTSGFHRVICLQNGGGPFSDTVKDNGPSLPAITGPNVCKVRIGGQSPRFPPMPVVATSKVRLGGQSPLFT